MKKKTPKRGEQKQRRKKKGSLSGVTLGSIQLPVTSFSVIVPQGGQIKAGEVGEGRGGETGTGEVWRSDT